MRAGTEAQSGQSGQAAATQGSSTKPAATLGSSAEAAEASTAMAVEGVSSSAEAEPMSGASMLRFRHQDNVQNDAHTAADS